MILTVLLSAAHCLLSVGPLALPALLAVEALRTMRTSQRPVTVPGLTDPDSDLEDRLGLHHPLPVLPFASSLRLPSSPLLSASAGVDLLWGGLERLDPGPVLLARVDFLRLRFLCLRLHPLFLRCLLQSYLRLQSRDAGRGILPDPRRCLRPSVEDRLGGLMQHHLLLLGPAHALSKGPYRPS